MKDLSVLVSSLRKKTEKLIEKHQSILLKNNILSEEILKLKEELAQKNQQIDAVENKLTLLKLAKGVGNESTKDVKLKINEMVREIDKCIAKISQ
ncbi:MAG: hypothetical protein COW67_02940 [Flavobacteriales bacterium CG18_big_fil_WC_8_21_14_2_50_32_9]|nr:MAG: hypothetical protein COW67_02940 [Flavobacteriales bacterium CG18_big_fil_WC_8_21_14_2_50_32_9]PIZ05497.1 MAG: hypothetical protein COY57_06970 [Flavobacteriales bacterium CG_4_10_14_0_8_um_filter_32_5]PJC62227.1 MAG: hypothetical protein CO022_05635 [Flavobacteriales bacterium CG_4_9_14_0_2_um_filter_32_27]